jgi:hypothetical protein
LFFRNPEPTVISKIKYPPVMMQILSQGSLLSGFLCVVVKKKGGRTD